MGTKTVGSIVTSVRNLIQDVAGIRWTDAEMIEWFNNALLEIVLFKPTANTQRVSIALAEGAIQNIPTTALQLLRITHNGTGETCRVIDQDRLDAADPTWRAAATDAVAQHWMYDPEWIREFQVYPPNDGTGSLSAVVSTPAAPVDELTDTITLDDIFAPAVVDYLLYRAYSKHSKAQGNDARAAGAYQRFLQQVGIKAQGEGALDPNATNKNQDGTE